MNTSSFLRYLAPVLVVFLVACGGVAGTAEPGAALATPEAMVPAQPMQPADAATSMPPSTAPQPTIVPPTAPPVEPAAESEALAQPSATRAGHLPDPSGPNPRPRADAAMVYDSESDLIVMMGGFVEVFTGSGAVWTFDLDEDRWTQMAPAPFCGGIDTSAVTYDSEADRTILSGVDSHCTMVPNETWAYDTNTDTWLQLTTGPANSWGARLVYDAESDKNILFGGDANEGHSPVDDTWAFDFDTNTWAKLNPAVSPPATSCEAMAYDAESDRVVIWGGVDANFNILTDVWAFDYNTETWTKMPPPTSGPTPAGDFFSTCPAMAYDAESDRTILYNLVPPPPPHYDGYDLVLAKKTWAYDYNTNTWELMAPPRNPGPISDVAIAYSNADDRVVVFGGRSGVPYSDIELAVAPLNLEFAGETWAYDYNNDVWVNMTVKQ